MIRYISIAISILYLNSYTPHWYTSLRLLRNKSQVQSLVPGTVVQMSDGSSRSIEELFIGNLITSYDLRVGKKNITRIQKIDRVFEHHVALYIFESGLRILASQDQLFRERYKGWCSLNPSKPKAYEGFGRVNRVQLGDLFQSKSGYEKLIKIDYTVQGQETIRISKISSGNNYLANGLVVGTMH